MQSIRNRALFFAVLGFVVGAIAAIVLPEVSLVQGLWGGFVGGLGGGAANACIRWMTRR